MSLSPAVSLVELNGRRVERRSSLGQLLAWIDSLDWILVIAICLTLGLAPFAPPHILEKLQMLAKGKLVKPIDWFDLLFHGIPWVLLFIKIALSAKR
jgi:hypothetical protein